MSTGFGNWKLSKTLKERHTVNHSTFIRTLTLKLRDGICLHGLSFAVKSFIQYTIYTLRFVHMVRSVNSGYHTSSENPMMRKQSWMASNWSLYSLLDTMSCITLPFALSMYLKRKKQKIMHSTSYVIFRTWKWCRNNKCLIRVSNLGAVFSGNLYFFRLSWW